MWKKLQSTIDQDFVVLGHTPRCGLFPLWTTFDISSSQPEFKVADPICTFLFSVLVIGTTVPVTKDIFRILMEGKHIQLPLCWWREFHSDCLRTIVWLFVAGAPRGVSFGAVRELLLSVGEVAAVNNLHMWSLNMNHSLLSAHIAIGRG